MNLKTTEIIANSRYIILYKNVNRGPNKNWWMSYARLFEDRAKAVEVALSLGNDFQIVNVPFDKHARKE